MIDISNITENLQFYLAVLVRVSGMLIGVPLIGGKEVPMRIKAAMALVLTLLIAPVVPMAHFTPSHDMLGFAAMAASELAVGLGIGFVALLTFSALQTAGELVGRQMSFAMANIVDPMFASQTSIVSRFNVTIGSMLLLSLNGHHWFLQAISDSFRRVPVEKLTWSGRITGLIAEIFGSVYYAGVRLAAPLLCAFLLVTIAVGILARIAPQLNVLMVGISLRIGAGLIALGLFVPHFVAFTRKLMFSMRTDIYRLIEVMKG